MNWFTRMLKAISASYAEACKGDLTPEEARLLIERFFRDESLDEYEWRDFLDEEERNPLVEQARRRIVDISVRHWASGKYGFCDPDGMRKIQEVADSLRQDSMATDS